MSDDPERFAARFARKRGGIVQFSSMHAADLSAAIASEVTNQIGGGGRTAAEIMRPLVLSMIRDAYAAGEREGISATKADLGDVVSMLVEKAIRGISLEHAPCPHCIGGRGEYGICEICNGSGKRA